MRKIWADFHQTAWLQMMAALLLGGVAQAQALYSEADFVRVPKLDAHVHVNVAEPSFLTLARKDGFELLSINVEHADGLSLASQAIVVQKQRAGDPVHFHYATTFSMKGFGTPGWTARTNRTIDQALAKGAVAVKVWKNIGMVEKDAQGHHIFIDDPRFDGVMRHIEERHIPLIAHQGEPKNCWLPFDQMTTENDRRYFRDHPQYYMYLHPDEPSYETLMAARDRFVAHHPNLSFVGAHMASLEWSVDELAKFLDRFPNANVDLAARMTQVQVQSNADYAKVRRFFIKYQDRLLYGTDITQNPPDPHAPALNPPATGRGFAYDTDIIWRSHWRYLATPLSQHVDAIKADARGLALPREVIDKIYYRNARRVFQLAHRGSGR